MLLSLYCLLALVPTEYGSSEADTLVICPPEFRTALQPWIDYRQQQGYRILVRTPAKTSFALRVQIRQLVKTGNFKHLVLIGDAFDRRTDPRLLVPTDYVPAQVNVRFGSEAEIATDNAFADIDSDGLVDLTVGRIPVDDAGELSRFVNRIIEYEKQRDARSWQRRINLVAGVGGFGQIIDKAIEQSVKQIITDLIPPQFDTTVTYGSWRSPYCPNPQNFGETAIGRFNEGCLFWIYVGHGHRGRLDQIRLPGRCYDILDNNTVCRINVSQGSPIAVCLSCYTAAVDDPQDGLAEEMLKQPRGPIAVISSSRVSMPYAMSLFSLEMLDGYFQGEAETLGELVLESKRKMVTSPMLKSRYHQLIESMGQAFSPDPSLLQAERLEHVHLMHLLGDPLLKLPRPATLKLNSPDRSLPGQTIQIAGRADKAGRLTLDLCYRRDRFRQRPPRRREFSDSKESLQEFQRVYDQAQDLICTRITRDVPAGPFSIPMQIPMDSSGRCFVRGELSAENYLALGSNQILIESMESARGTRSR